MRLLAVLFVAIGLAFLFLPKAKEQKRAFNSKSKTKNSKTRAGSK